MRAVEVTLMAHQTWSKARFVWAGAFELVKKLTGS